MVTFIPQASFHFVKCFYREIVVGKSNNIYWELLVINEYQLGNLIWRTFQIHSLRFQPKFSTDFMIKLTRYGLSYQPYNAIPKN